MGTTTPIGIDPAAVAMAFIMAILFEWPAIFFRHSCRGQVPIPVLETDCGANAFFLFGRSDMEKYLLEFFGGNPALRYSALAQAAEIARSSPIVRNGGHILVRHCGKV